MLFADPCHLCKKEDASICTGCKVVHYCNATCQKQDWQAHRSDCKKLAPYKHMAKEVVIKQSSIPNAGSGVFADRDFKKGEEVGVYFGKIADSNLLTTIEKGWHPYAQATGDHSILGSPIPPAHHLSMQIVNDPLITSDDINMLSSVNCLNLTKDYLSKIEKFVTKYVTASTSTNKTNLEFSKVKKGLYPVWVATRDILKGEELFKIYEFPYWISIPTEICIMKGRPIEACEIEKSVYRGVQAAGRDPQDYGCIEPEQLQLESNSYKEYLLTSSLSRLIADGSKLMIMFSGISAKTKFDNLATQFKLGSRLDEIASIPNHEFYHPVNGIRVHPRSKQLIRDLLAFLKASNNDKILSFKDVSGDNDVEVGPDFFAWLALTKDKDGENKAP